MLCVTVVVFEDAETFLNILFEYIDIDTIHPRVYIMVFNSCTGAW